MIFVFGDGFSDRIAKAQPTTTTKGKLESVRI